MWEEFGQRARGVLPGDQEMERAPARKPARPKRRQAAEKAGVERRRRSVAWREVVVEEKTFGELSMASANSLATVVWVGKAPDRSRGRRGGGVVVVDAVDGMG
ncbi:Os11g0654150 [Oryza sativa Japonica Group]|uniref:Os11g0654150 protein n=1 Tax=Oryza sativa subsp. japonica TaxID=39947 RepID=A0A0P0Y508_ORYSJ|nr:Os11g0654150 [Oryza sativa Japonica Group]